MDKFFKIFNKKEDQNKNEPKQTNLPTSNHTTSDDNNTESTSSNINNNNETIFQSIKTTEVIVVNSEVVPKHTEGFYSLKYKEDLHNLSTKTVN